MSGCLDFGLDFPHGIHGRHYEPMHWGYFNHSRVSSTPEPKEPGPSRNRKYLRGKMKGTWQDDCNFYQKYFPLQAQGRAHARVIKDTHYNEKAKRWKRINPKPKSTTSLVATFCSLLNTILERSGISKTQRVFLKPHPQTMKSSRKPLPPPDLLLAGVGPAFIANAQGLPVPEYSSCLVPVQIMLESEYKRTKRHLSAVHANEIFQRQDNRRFIFALILTESFMRAFVFDPAGCVVASQFDYHARPAEFCAVIAGMASLDEVKVGFDTSIILDDQLKARIWTMERTEGVGSPPRATSYYVKSRIFKAPKLVSRATCCWLVESVEEPHKTYVIKDAWMAPSETQNEMEGSLIMHANKRGVTCGLVRIRHQERIMVPGRSEDTIVKNRRIRGSTLTDGMWTVQDRVHTRIVMNTYGKPIWKFSSRMELLVAFHDAVQAHRNLYQMAEILHRDVSIGNILINADPHAEEGDRGILIDLDFAVRLGKLTSGPMTVGTRRFMSHNLLQSLRTHSHLDDLESFYYVLCWLICEYDGPGDISTSRIEKTPQLLEEWDAKDDGVAKLQHMRESFELPVQAWFGDGIRQLAMRLHGFFHCRVKGGGPRPDPERDYGEFIGHIKHAIQNLGPQDDVELTIKVEPDVLEVQGIPSLPLKRKAAEVDVVLEEPKAKRAVPVCTVLAQRPRRTKANYKRT